MKKFVISILAIILIVTATASVGVLSAEESDVYYQIKDDVVLFDGNDTDMTVVLPAGYWLKKESVDAIKGHIIASYNGYTVRFKQSDESILKEAISNRMRSYNTFILKSSTSNSAASLFQKTPTYPREQALR